MAVIVPIPSCVMQSGGSTEMRATNSGMITSTVKDGRARRYKRVRSTVKPGKPARYGSRSKS